MGWTAEEPQEPSQVLVRKTSCGAQVGLSQALDGSLNLVWMQPAKLRAMGTRRQAMCHDGLHCHQLGEAQDQKLWAAPALIRCETSLQSQVWHHLGKEWQMRAVMVPRRQRPSAMQLAQMGSADVQECLRVKPGLDFLQMVVDHEIPFEA